MKSAYEVILEPIITEKSTDGLINGKYTFKVAKTASKPEIRIAAEKLFGVKVLNVNTINVKGKKKRVNNHLGYTSDWKKAIITIDLDPEDVVYTSEGGKEVKVKSDYKTSIEEFGFGQ